MDAFELANRFVPALVALAVGLIGCGAAGAATQSIFYTASYAWYGIVAGCGTILLAVIFAGLAVGGAIFVAKEVWNCLAYWMRDKTNDDGQYA